MKYNHKLIIFFQESHIDFVSINGGHRESTIPSPNDVPDEPAKVHNNKCKNKITPIEDPPPAYTYHL